MTKPILCTYCEVSSAGTHGPHCPMNPSNASRYSDLPTGWLCPRCSQVHSPFRLSCDCLQRAALGTARDFVYQGHYGIDTYNVPAEPKTFAVNTTLDFWDNERASWTRELPEMTGAGYD